MNSFINVMLSFILFPTMLIAIYVGMDMPLTFLKTTGQYLPYKFEIFLGIGIFILVLLLRRSVKRWMGMNIVTKTKRFKWNASVSKARKKRIVTYQALEAIIMLCAAIALYTVAKEAWAPALAFGFGVVDNIIFAIVGLLKDGFRIGLSSKALIVADREVTLLYFSGLRKVSVQQESIYFDYIKDLQLSFPSNCIEESTKKDFLTQLEAEMDPEKVYFSKNLGE